MKDNPDSPVMRDDLVIGRGPVLELLKTDRPVDSIFMQHSSGGSLGKIAAIARSRGIVIKETTGKKLDSLCSGGNHQGVVAQVAAARYYELEELFAAAVLAGEPPFFIISDGIEDPHNLGAIIRTAEASGAHGLIVPKRRNVGLTYTVGKTSAGAVEHLPVARVGSIAATIDQLKERGLWIYAADFEGEPWCAQDYAGPVALVVGAEGAGVSRLIRAKCDFIVSLPMRGQVSSLNVSVAAGIVCYEIARQRMGLSAISPKASNTAGSGSR